MEWNLSDLLDRARLRRDLRAVARRDPVRLLPAACSVWERFLAAWHPKPDHLRWIMDVGVMLAREGAASAARLGLCRAGLIALEQVNRREDGVLAFAALLAVADQEHMRDQAMARDAETDLSLPRAGGSLRSRVEKQIRGMITSPDYQSNVSQRVIRFARRVMDGFFIKNFVSLKDADELERTCSDHLSELRIHLASSPAPASEENVRISARAKAIGLSSPPVKRITIAKDDRLGIVLDATPTSDFLVDGRPRKGPLSGASEAGRVILALVDKEELATTYISDDNLRKLNTYLRKRIGIHVLRIKGRLQWRSLNPGSSFEFVRGGSNP